MWSFARGVTSECLGRATPIFAVLYFQSPHAEHLVLRPVTPLPFPRLAG